MSSSLMILGRQPALGLAELESLYGAEKVRAAGAQAAIVEVDPCLLAYERLGGSVKFCKILTTLDTTNWQQIEKFLMQVSPDHSRQMPEGKMQLGLSLYGFNESLRRIEATGLSLKKAIRQTGRSVRLIPNKSTELNTAQVLHNKLVGENGWELVFVRDGSKTIVAQTVKVQDIESYARRDRDRPKRDTRVGMLPPKLAQIIINLAAGKLPEEKLQNICDIPLGQPIPRKLLGQTMLDPFCGTGVLLQEALLMGYDVFGSDIEQRMVDYTAANLNEWLTVIYPDIQGNIALAKGDATSYKWGETLYDDNDEAYFVPEKIFAVASETYLGRPYNSLPDAETLARNMADCNLIIKKFLQNIHSQVKAGTRFCLAVPAWQIRPNQFKHLPLVDQIEDLGYNRVSFEHLGDEDLIYYRPDQIVARQLLVITRK